MEISRANVKRSTIDEPCCELVSLVRARLTLKNRGKKNKTQ